MSETMNMQNIAAEIIISLLFFTMIVFRKAFAFYVVDFWSHFKHKPMTVKQMELNALILGISGLCITLFGLYKEIF